ncbi:lamin tail domain-containing protein [Candidatus Parcubacteria bacterium]|nr:lamin tail domain-containing protein [Candidatus Parcubacteria bacterium]
MSSRFKRGEGNLDGILIIAFLIVIMLLAPKGSGKGFFSSPTLTGSGTAIGPASGSHSSPSSFPSPSSSYRSLSVGSGNAAYENQSYKEYVTVENWGDKPVDITGWTLKNGKDKRSYDVGGQLQRFSADVARIPQAAPLLLPSGGSPLQDVVLQRGERAVITTGLVSVNSPYRITSFKENSCTGYLEALPDYAFEPGLQMSCPSPYKEPGLDGLDTACRLFVGSLSSCETPKFDAKNSKGEECATCVHGRELSNACAAFIRQHFSYQGCVAYHAGDPSFSSGKTWRVFLGRSWEMWAPNYESIELFDRFGTLAASQNY